MFDMLRAGLFGRRHSMCGTQSHITLQKLTKFTYEQFIKKSPAQIAGSLEIFRGYLAIIQQLFSIYLAAI